MTRRKLRLSLLLCALLLPAVSAMAKTAVVVPQQSGPYAELVNSLRKGAVDFEVVDLKDGGQMSDLTPAKYSAVLAVGDVVPAVFKAIPAGMPFYYTMTYNPPVLESAQVSGVVLKIPIKSQLKKLNELFPKRKRIGMLYNPRLSGEDVKDARDAAPVYNQSIYALAVEGQEQVPETLKRITQATTDVCLIIVDQTVAHPAVLKQMVEWTQKEKIPLVGLSVFHLKSGALVAFSVDFHDIGLQTADLMQQGGGKVQTPRKINVYYNPDLQRQMGIDDLKIESSMISMN